MKKFNLVINKNWIKIFDEIDKDVYEETEKNYNKLLDSKINIFPIYKNIFNFTNYSIPDEIKVVCLGQDPYHGLFMNLKTNCFNPQAMGLAFSVPLECKIPPSLDNIYNNMLKFGHIIKKPTHGNLDFFAYQGVLLLNTSSPSVPEIVILALILPCKFPTKLVAEISPTTVKLLLMYKLPAILAFGTVKLPFESSIVIGGIPTV